MSEKASLDVENLVGSSYWPALPVFLISTADSTGRPNVAPFTIVTFASYTNIGPMDDSIGPSTVAPKVITIGIGGGLGKSFYGKKTKRTFRNIAETREFVVNIPSVECVKAVNICEFRISDTTKFEASGLTPVSSTIVKSPSVKECRVHYECRLMKIDDFGGQMDTVWGHVVAARVDEQLLKASRDERMRVIAPIFHYPGRPARGLFYSLGSIVSEEATSLSELK